MLSDELFSKAEFNNKIGLKTSKKVPGAPVIDITRRGVRLNVFTGIRTPALRSTTFHNGLRLDEGYQTIKSLITRIFKIHLVFLKQCVQNFIFKSFDFCELSQAINQISPPISKIIRDRFTFKTSK
jgi:hypothetical protein